MNKQLLTGAVAVGTLAIGSLLQAAPAEALNLTTFGFRNITNNKPIDAAIGESQLFVDVLETTNSNQVRFNFRNVGPLASSITDVYFDDGELLSIAQIINSSGVDFSQGASPGNLPGGNTINFQTTAGFSTDSNSPVQPNGVNPGEVLGVLFNLQNGKTFNDVINAMNLSLLNPDKDILGGLRIGIHVQGFQGGGSESFVNSTPIPSTPIPTPALLPGLLGMSVAALRKKKQGMEAAQNA